MSKAAPYSHWCCANVPLNGHAEIKLKAAVRAVSELGIRTEQNCSICEKSCEAPEEALEGVWPCEVCGESLLCGTDVEDSERQDFLHIPHTDKKIFVSVTPPNKQEQIRVSANALGL